MAKSMFPGYANHREIMPNWVKEGWKPHLERLQALLTDEEIKQLVEVRNTPTTLIIWE